MERRLAAILVADVVGYSRLMSANEVGTLAALRELHTGLIDTAIADAGGRVVKLMGDGILAEYSSVHNALNSALTIQSELESHNTKIPEDRQIRLRIGVNIGDIIIEDDDIFGDGVNVAARIEALARPGGIAVSGAVKDQVGNRLNITFDAAGEQQLKNIDGAVPVFHVQPKETDKPIASDHAGRPSIAVLPFSNFSDDRGQEYFADGITEDLITDLSRLSGLFVVSRNSSFVYKNRPSNLQGVARDLGVRYILEGSVRKAGDRIRITAQLIDGLSDGHVWAERFDRDLSDIFALQDEITKTIIDQLHVRLLETETADASPTKSANAYTCYLKGRQLYHMRTKHYMERARASFLEALHHDPNYARAYVGLADCEARMNDWHGGDYPVDDILAMAGRALDLSPDMAEAHAAKGLALQTAGRDKEAAAAYETALQLDPLCYEAQHNYARFLRIKKDYEKCAYHFIRALEIMPEDFRSPLLLEAVYQELGKPHDAVRYMELGLKRAEEESQRNPDNPDALELAAAVLAANGDIVRAKEWLDRAVAVDPDGQLTEGYNLACTYALIGETDEAINWLERIIHQQGHSQMQWMESDPDFESIRDHPRFLKLLAKTPASER